MSELADKFEFRVRWEPFLLRPNTPMEGIPKPARFADPNNPSVQNLKQAGRDVGIDFTHRTSITPNTLKAHALMEFAERSGQEAAQNKAAERLFEAYFTNGDLLSEEVILNVAKEVGLDQSEVKAYVTNDKVIDAIKVKAQSWSQKGVTGVPYYYVNGHGMFSGAQDVETFKHMIRMASEKYPLSASSQS